MRTSPPESNFARLLKFRRVHRRERRKNRETETDLSGSPESSLGWTTSPGDMSPDWVSAKDRAVISIAIPGISSLEPLFCEQARRSLAVLLHKTPKRGICSSRKNRGRTGFDSSLEAQAACRGWFVGLVKNRTKKNKRRSRRSSSRGLIDRDVSGATPASVGNVDSRLANRRSDRAGL